ncbi:hypothetical protein CEXT_726301 [Caerostris extrusa]|uniref:Uncharacterized protein n=1 Tax=Caerostris extrusa TaxID=172846 RepID=A0AAV4UH75_CAEEX|nr:hypothetical protein CEXT_726301 [Caerostris extrusa]
MKPWYDSHTHNRNPSVRVSLSGPHPHFDAIHRFYGESDVTVTHERSKQQLSIHEAMERATYPVVPQVIFAILATSAGCMVLLLPETKDCSIPDTVKESVVTDRKSLSKNTEEIWILNKLKNKKPSIKS